MFRQVLNAFKDYVQFIGQVLLFDIMLLTPDMLVLGDFDEGVSTSYHHVGRENLLALLIHGAAACRSYVGIVEEECLKLTFGGCNAGELISRIR